MDATEPPSLRSRLAIVEDDEELREKIMVPALRAAGFDAVGLASALELYRTWAGSPFDLVLLDVGLPDDDGIEIAQPVPREALIANLTSNVEGFDPHRLEMLVYRLRRKCQETSGETLPLQAVRGVGYLFGP